VVQDLPRICVHFTVAAFLSSTLIPEGIAVHPENHQTTFVKLFAQSPPLSPAGSPFLNTNGFRAGYDDMVDQWNPHDFRSSLQSLSDSNVLVAGCWIS